MFNFEKYYYLFLFTALISILLLSCQFIPSLKSNKSISPNNNSFDIHSNDLNQNSDSTNNYENANNNSDDFVIPCSNAVHITIREFINNQQCSSYLVKENETLNDILMRYNSTCAPNASLKLIKELNNITSTNDVKAGTTLKIPETTMKNGSLYTISQGDTWSKICEKYYPVYDIDSIMKLLIFINDYKNDILPLGDTIFLPKI
ncbi:LysM peptidoglycan-binding domain-containing protein [Clostridium butyricum]|uniref:LysM peptidoglycan-binding domain-containing protein n=1 Tax=Clostridium butyricum TaxID=1492 RepID=UPI002ABD8070|nr:LysM peptidoglycan-binding domain-containing protein [Clostridium butyricum]